MNTMNMEYERVVNTSDRGVVFVIWGHEVFIPSEIIHPSWRENPTGGSFPMEQFWAEWMFATVMFNLP